MKKFQQLIYVLLCMVLVVTSLIPATTTAFAANLRDVPSSMSASTAINWAVDNGFMEAPGNFFAPAQVVKEQDLVITFAKADDNYIQTPLPHQAADSAYMFYQDLYLPFNGYNQPNMRNAQLTRGDFARIYAAFKGLDLDEMQAVQYMYATNVTTGITGARTFKDYNPSGLLTKAALASFLHRSTQVETFAVKGLVYAPAGRDNDKVTLPPGFDGNTTVEFPPEEDNGGNDIVGPGVNNGAISDIRVEKQDLIANGHDTTDITITLQSCDGRQIAQDKSYEFQVRSKFGGRVIGPDNELTRVVHSDGNKVTARILAPALTKSVRDTITLELVNNKDPELKCLEGKKIEVGLRYLPKAEMRIDYEVYDPQKGGGEVEPPGPVYPPYVELPKFYQQGIMFIHDIYTDPKKMHTGQQTNVEDPLGNVTNEYLEYGKNGNADDDGVEYEHASLKFEDYKISVWLFEQIVQRRLNESAFYPIDVRYSISPENRPVYQFQGIDDGIASAVENINSVGSIIELMSYLPAEADLTLEHYDSVKAIWAIYESLGEYERNVFLKYNKGKTLGQLEAYLKRVEALKESEIAANRPPGMARYTKVMVNLVAPGGEVITDYQGTVKITFDGEEKTASFITNTSSAITGSGSAGTAVAYFDSVIYGDSQIEVEMTKPVDPRYEKSLNELIGKTHEKAIYTNQLFTQNSCSADAEVAYVVDYSTSMMAADRDNYRAFKTRQLIKQVGASNNIIIKAGEKSSIVTQGDTKKVLEHSLFDNMVPSGSTNLLTGVDMAFSRFSDDRSTSKAIVIVSDGNTTDSELNNIIRQAKEKDIKIYTVGLGDSTQVNDRVLQKLSKDTGGQYFRVGSKIQFHNAYQALINSILCRRVYDSCAIGGNALTETMVRANRGVVTMRARTDQNCDTVKRVEVRYKAANGNIQFTLPARGKHLFLAQKQQAVLEDFALSTRVEFLAYDKDGKLLSTQTTNVQ